MLGADPVLVNDDRLTPNVFFLIKKHGVDIIIVGTLGTLLQPVRHHACVSDSQKRKVGPIDKPVVALLNQMGWTPVGISQGGIV